MSKKQSHFHLVRSVLLADRNKQKAIEFSFIHELFYSFVEILDCLLLIPPCLFSGNAFVSILKTEFMKALFVSICMMCLITASAQVKKNTTTKQPGKTVM